MLKNTSQTLEHLDLAFLAVTLDGISFLTEFDIEKLDTLILSRDYVPGLDSEGTIDHHLARIVEKYPRCQVRVFRDKL